MYKSLKKLYHKKHLVLDFLGTSLDFTISVKWISVSVLLLVGIFIILKLIYNLYFFSELFIISDIYEK